MTRSDRDAAAKLADTILLGDARELSAELPAEIAECIVTSPPYFGHRKYADESERLELGRETKPEVYVERLVEYFAAIRRLLKPTGSLWLNLGDSYRSGRLLGIPWRVALALQDDGWLLRSDVIWHKPNAMPSSVKNRPTTDHEYIFLLTTGRDYYYDIDAIREPHVTFTEQSRMRGGRGHLGRRGGTPEAGKNGGDHNLHDSRWDQAFHPKGRNKRTVWSVPLGKCREAHFAVFSEALIEPCIKAGCPEGGLVLDPFMGAGTTALVARRLNRRYLGFELVPRYAELARERLATGALDAA